MNHAFIDILIIEDSLYDAELTIRALKKENPDYIIKILTDGEEAFRYIDETIVRMHYYPRIIILDLKLPKIDGIDVLKKLKGSDITSSIPVVILSSSNEVNDVTACYSSGANSYVPKVVDVDEFFNSLKCICDYWLKLNVTLIR
ncbi:MAG: response regulator [Candidatus Cloacimonetes bacterium]|nr:response regulator [Candidatus Cloacimonadota bacterium]